MYTFSSKLKTFSFALMIVGLLGVAYGFLTTPNSVEDVKVMLAESHETHGEVATHNNEVKATEVHEDMEYSDDTHAEHAYHYLKNKPFVHNCTITDPLPRIIILEGIGILSLGKKLKDQKISYDIFRSMASSVLDAERIGRFKSIVERDIFKMEYWPLERAKLDNAKAQSLDGNNVIITGGGGTIGMAIAKKFRQEGWRERPFRMLC